MIALPPKTHVWIAAGVTDLRRGFDGLSALVQTKLEQSPFSGHVFVFRGRRGDLARGVNHRNLHAGAKARIEPHGRAGARRRCQQKIAQIAREHAHRLVL